MGTGGSAGVGTRGRWGGGCVVPSIGGPTPNPNPNPNWLYGPLYWTCPATVPLALALTLAPPLTLTGMKGAGLAPPGSPRAPLPRLIVGPPGAISNPKPHPKPNPNPGPHPRPPSLPRAASRWRSATAAGVVAWTALRPGSPSRPCPYSETSPPTPPSWSTSASHERSGRSRGSGVR